MVISKNMWVGPVQGGLSFAWEPDPSLADGFVDPAGRPVRHAVRPLAVVSHQGGVIDRVGWASRVNAHIDVVRAAAPGR